MNDFTLGGYMATHERAAAFTGPDGQAYSVAIWVDDEPDAQGRFGAALLFVRWSRDGTATTGHVESDTLAWGRTREEAEARLAAWSLYDVRAELDQAVARRPEGW